MTKQKSLDSVKKAAKEAHEQASVLARALPYLRRYTGDTIVVKYGGHAMVDNGLSNAFGNDIALLKQVGINPIVVHGGGPQINAMLERMDVETTFVDGLRVTNAAIIDVIEMVLAGTVNKQVATLINQAGALAVGISGKDGGLIEAQKLMKHVWDDSIKRERTIDLGLVGQPVRIDPRVLYALSGSGLIPVVAPIGMDKQGQTYNINADIAAGAIAGAVRASRLFMLTDVPGVLDKDGNLISELTEEEAKEAIANGVITGGMIPKIETCLEAVKAGAQAAVIMDGRVPHACLLELFTEGGSGTIIRPNHS
ncbi:N-acetylglutamate kinase (ArgB) (PDB:3S6G) [Commensalibacter communis]|uniref:Acetylglutamate kinase n=1 Tax=Commensalibacter communis TaxID=2972786 RepID=A0A9W4XI49_9PROT|nr:acetylglutamate kinase [Commensalibacter communis]CAI3923878.1 N-acetylglutamate kinase (ArgB) (PDB:3S6G) [Commensalibacter communis]CAI3924390.1 N-acetylglutamate kinase (ArgB) (PDB:3S6G) [Commensalibacter communis]CAI3936582.1 N-acetylglutamate kinase (ArgB) (PDB:3S6G) [Commensalibacter communis]CAI3946171.1 N-acetylglutamate kinase (ArgB) (PDB:3S6G) [Commensalibacter communis]CAI3946260.1 N-acetylglutamate kinase (ArgB) (PDB:3S6G) [Commensalibacter communis]